MSLKKDELVRWCANKIQEHSREVLRYIDLLQAAKMMPEQANNPDEKDGSADA